MAGMNRSTKAERMIQEYELNLRGYSLREIADITGVSHVTVSRDLSQHIKARVLPQADEYRKQTIDRLTIAIKALMGEIDEGKSIARNAEVLGKLEERLSKMLGADAPIEQAVEHTLVQDPEVLAMLAHARTVVAVREQGLLEE